MYRNEWNCHTLEDVAMKEVKKMMF